jgi:hypothetical protein
MANRSGTVDAQVVFLDIVSYSKRKSTIQKQVVERLQSDIRATLIEVGRENLEYIQANNVNFATDVVIIPTGDGAALAFTFGGMQTLGISFSTSFLKRVHDEIIAHPCQRFAEHGWCNCHSYYLVRIGISEGKVIVYEDVNGIVNIAGTTINDAARIMDKADASQILMTELAYINLIDITDDNSLENKIIGLGQVRVKHDKEMTTYQFVGSDEPYISRSRPLGVEIESQMNETMARLGLPSTRSAGMDRSKLLEMAKALGGAMDQIQAIMPGSPFNLPKDKQ